MDVCCRNDMHSLIQILQQDILYNGAWFEPYGSNLLLCVKVKLHPYGTIIYEQGKSEGFGSCDRPSNLAQIWSKSSIFQPVWPWNLMNDLGKQ